MLMQGKLHFLIVDDDETIAQLHIMMLEKAGHNVTVLTSSTEVLTKIFPLILLFQQLSS
jgi:CheY-like chemotaxis protein